MCAEVAIASAGSKSRSRDGSPSGTAMVAAQHSAAASPAQFHSNARPEEVRVGGVTQLPSTRVRQIAVSLQNRVQMCECGAALAACGEFDLCTTPRAAAHAKLP